jgi:hypothetical protein
MLNLALCTICHKEIFVSPRVSRGKKRLVCRDCIRDRSLFCPQTVPLDADLPKYYNYDTKTTKHLREDVEEFIYSTRSDDYYLSEYFGHCTVDERTEAIVQFCEQNKMKYYLCRCMSPIETFIELGLMNEVDENTFFEQAKEHYFRFYDYEL